MNKTISILIFGIGFGVKAIANPLTVHTPVIYNMKIESKSVNLEDYSPFSYSSEALQMNCHTHQSCDFTIALFPNTTADVHLEAMDREPLCSFAITNTNNHYTVEAKLNESPDDQILCHFEGDPDKNLTLKIDD